MTSTARARGGGADTLIPPSDQDDGVRSYAACDLEEQVWGFGSFDSSKPA